MTPISLNTQHKISNLSNRTIHPSNAANIPTTAPSTRTLTDSHTTDDTKPYCVLDAPNIIDDFYSSILDWNAAKNLVAVSLTDQLYFYDVATKRVIHLTPNTNDIKAKSPSITSVNFQPLGENIAVGTERGTLSIYNVERQHCLSTIQNDECHIGVLEWSKHWNHRCIAYGSKLHKSIYLHDLRADSPTISIKTPTKSVSLKWSPDSNKFAIGGRDRCVSVFDIRYLKSRVFKLKYHTSSIRAIAWSTHNYNVLMSGGGALDKKLCLWNLNVVNGFKSNFHANYVDYNCVTINKPMKCLRTESQVCNIIWNPFRANQILTTHGFDTNDINLWEIGEENVNGQPIKTLTGHQKRVLYVALGSDQKDIVTASNDETLQFWNVFGESRNGMTMEKLEATMSQRLGFNIR